MSASDIATPSAQRAFVNPQDARQQKPALQFLAAWPCSIFSRSRINHAASDGVSVSARTNDVSSETTIVNASARKNTPANAGQKCQRNKHDHRRERRADERRK